MVGTFFYLLKLIFDKHFLISSISSLVNQNQHKIGVIKIFQINVNRLVLIFLIQGIMSVFFLFLAVRLIIRRKQRINIYLSGFLISVVVGAVLNMIYALLFMLEYADSIIISLNLITNFFIFYSLIFLTEINLMLLKYNKFTPGKQYLLMFIYGLLLLIGILLPNVISLNAIGQPIWSFFFFLYIVTLMTLFAILPFVISSLRLAMEHSDKKYKKKWLYYVVGLIGLFFYLYMICFANLLNNAFFLLIVSLISPIVIISCTLIYFGIGQKKID